jgi:hypothetical protein
MYQFVTTAVADQWTGIDCKEEVMSEPSFLELKPWIDRLDARTWTMISISSRSGSTLTIGGGSGQYVVIMAPKEEEFWNLIRPASENEGDVRINIGGQEGEYPGRQVVDYPEALRATETFVSTGEMDPTLDWEQES